MKTFFVSWRYRGQFYRIDIDSENRAIAVCVALAELGDRRSEIALTEVDFEIDPEVRDRIRKRISERIAQADWANAEVFA